MPQISVRSKVLRRFYEPLLLLNALGQIRGERIKAETDSSSPSPNIQKIRRSFVDGIAYICAYQKGPPWVTAAALEKTPEGVTVWLAANEELGGNVTEFLQNVLSDIQKIAVLDDRESRLREAERMREALTSRIIAFNAARIEIYFDQVRRKHAPQCLKIMNEERKGNNHTIHDPHVGLERLVEWLRENFVEDNLPLHNENELQTLVRKCYEQRRTLSFETLRHCAGQGETRRLEFEQLYKLLCKLGKHVHVAKKLIEAAVSLSQDFAEGFQIKTLPSSKEQKLPLKPKEATIESTLGRMYSSTEERNRFMARLQFIWDPLELSELLERQHSTKTRVHAELLLIDHFDKFGCIFLGGDDRYIGCSKPACYMCHAYITRHPGRYAVPPSHQKLYIGWRLPDVDSTDPSYIKRQAFQEKMLLKLIDKVREDIVTDIESRTSRHPFHADSTIGMSSVSKALSYVSENLPKDLSLGDVDIAGIDVNRPDSADNKGSEAQLDAEDVSDDEGGVRSA